MAKIKIQYADENTQREVEVENGLTLTDLLGMLTQDGHERVIRVNRQTQSSDYQLQPGDRVVTSPRKIEGHLVVTWC